MATRNIGEAYIQDVIEDNWGITVTNVDFIPQGVSTTNWYITDNAGNNYVFKDCGSYGAYAQFQCDIWHHIRSKFPFEVPKPLELESGGTVAPGSNDSHFILYPFISGQTADHDPDVADADVGQMLAAYHNAVMPMNWVGRKQLRSKELLSPDGLLPHLDITIKRLGLKAVQTEVDREFLTSARHLGDQADSIIGSVDSLAYNQLTRLPCHGDFGSQNILSYRGRLIGLIDLGGVVIDPRILDVQFGIASRAYHDDMFDEAAAYAFIAGYDATAELSTDEVSLIMPLMFADSLRRLCWQLQELVRPNQTRVQPEDAETYLQKTLLLGKLCITERL